MIRQFFIRMKNGSRKVKAAKLSVASNSLLVISKLVIGVITGSVSVISEAAHSAVDLLAACIAYYAVKTASKPPDEKHTYGHGKVENISGAVEAVLIVFAALWIIYESLQKLNIQEVPGNLEYGIAIMAVSIIVNITVSRYLFRVAKETQSHALEADALHLQADVWTSTGVLGGLLAIKLTGLYWLDPGIAIVVACIIFKVGYKMTKKSISELNDVAFNAKDQMVIESILEAHQMVKGFTHLRTRRSGSMRLIDVHLLLDKNLKLDMVHRVCDELEQEIKDRLAPCDVLVHVEPYGD